MQQVSLKQLAAGMILARDVEDIDDHRILAKGTVLTAPTIALLSGWGIADAYVELPVPKKEPQETVQAPPPDLHDYAIERLKKTFEGRIVNEWMQALYEQAVRHIEVRRRWGGAP